MRVAKWASAQTRPDERERRLLRLRQFAARRLCEVNVASAGNDNARTGAVAGFSPALRALLPASGESDQCSPRASFLCNRSPLCVQDSPNCDAAAGRPSGAHTNAHKPARPRVHYAGTQTVTVSSSQSYPLLALPLFFSPATSFQLRSRTGMTSAPNSNKSMPTLESLAGGSPRTSTTTSIKHTLTSSYVQPSLQRQQQPSHHLITPDDTDRCHTDLQVSSQSRINHSNTTTREPRVVIDSDQKPSTMPPLTNQHGTNLHHPQTSTPDNDVCLHPSNIKHQTKSSSNMSRLMAHQETPDDTYKPNTPLQIVATEVDHTQSSVVDNEHTLIELKPRTQLQLDNLDTSSRGKKKPTKFALKFAQTKRFKRLNSSDDEESEHEKTPPPSPDNNDSRGELASTEATISSAYDKGIIEQLDFSENENDNINQATRPSSNNSHHTSISQSVTGTFSKISDAQFECLSNLIKIIRSGNYNDFAELLERRSIKSNLMNVFVDGHTPLHYSIIYGRSLDWCRQLVLNGADPNLSNRAGWHPIHLAAYNGSRDTMRYLIDCYSNQ